MTRTLMIMAVLLLVELSSGFESVMMLAGLKAFYVEFRDPTGVGWMITIWGLVAASSAAICGRLGDIYGRRRVLIIVLIICTAGSLLSAVTTELGWVIAGRALQGVGGAMFALLYGLARENIPHRHLPLCLGLITGMAGVTAGLALVIGGIIVDNFHWSVMFYFAAAFGVLGLMALLFFIPRSPQRPLGGKLDILGGILFAPAIAAFLLAISNLRTWGFLDPKILGLLAVGVVLTAAWIRRELTHPSPLVDIRLLANREVGLLILCMMLLSVGALQHNQVLSLFFQQPVWTGVGLGLSATAAGLIKLPVQGGGILGSVIAGHISAARGARTTLLAGAALTAAGWIAILLRHGDLPFVLVSTVVAYSGILVAYAAINIMLVAAVPAGRASEVTGMAVTTRSAFGAVGAQSVATLLSLWTVGDASRGPGVFPTGSAYLAAFGFVSGLSILLFLVALLVPKDLGVVARLDMQPNS